ncbi:hypothetical protein AMTR_s00070p00194990 [Amborella trichopoda]|uniref:C2H2-type domain-containing protein n=1 Tax=Amborella trichopoda TaxID=13333 RepID=U5DGR9_AMBTC|nr:hypothetical protein AMTR_s00070p00194990 [Amborella trichopoda]
MGIHYREDGREGETTRVHSCRICLKAFEKYHALGGHHTKPRKPKAEKEVQKHQCSMCHMEFDTGQGLGGHMRRH